MSVSLSGFCEVQKMIWEKYTQSIKNAKCKNCESISLKMTSKWQCKCANCGQLHKVKKPINFPKNMDDKRNWKTTCEECGGIMDFRQGGAFGAYVCRKCSNILEV